jgi:hypothetical protein
LKDLLSTSAWSELVARFNAVGTKATAELAKMAIEKSFISS